MAYTLFEEGTAEEVYERALSYQGEHCFFLEVTDSQKGLGRCTQYFDRPLVCRSFGVAARKNKNNQIEYSVCKPLKENKSDEYQALLGKREGQVPYIEILSSKLAGLDPAFLEQQFPINKSLCIILEKLFMYSAYASTDEMGALRTASPEILNFSSSP